jgi:hypothetical protein
MTPYERFNCFIVRVSGCEQFALPIAVSALGPGSLGVVADRTASREPRKRRAVGGQTGRAEASAAERSPGMGDTSLRTASGQNYYYSGGP